MSLSLILFKNELTFEDLEALMAISATEITSTAYVTNRTPLPRFVDAKSGKPTAIVVDFSFPDHDVTGAEASLAGTLKGLVTQNFRESMRKIQAIGA